MTDRQELRPRRARCGPARLSPGPRGPPGHRGGGWDAGTRPPPRSSRALMAHPAL